MRIYCANRGSYWEKLTVEHEFVLKVERDKRKVVCIPVTKVAGHRIEHKEKNPAGCGENSTDYYSCQSK